MAVPRDRDARKFHRAATERLEDARVLHAAGRDQAAIYLAGYSVECGLKALLVERTPAAGRPARLLTFRGVHAHDYRWLRVRLAAAGVFPGAAERTALDAVRFWSTSLRYDPSRGDVTAARGFIAAAATILGWVERSL